MMDGHAIEQLWHGLKIAALRLAAQGFRRPFNSSIHKESAPRKRRERERGGIAFGGERE